MTNAAVQLPDDASLLKEMVRHLIDDKTKLQRQIEKKSNVRELFPDRWKPLFETELAKRPMAAPSVRAASVN